MHIENKRVRTIVDFLIFHKKIRNATDFANQMEFHSGNMTQILKGERGVSHDLKWRIYNTFHINKLYVFGGAGELDFEPTQEIIDEKNELYKLRETVKSLNRTIKAMEKTIKAQDITIAGLNKELEEKQDTEPVQEKIVAKKTGQINTKMQKSR